MLVVRARGIDYGRRRMMTTETARNPGGSRFSWRAVWPWLAAASSGGLATLCLAPWNQEWLCWLALTPLLVAVWLTTDAPARLAGEGESRASGRLARVWRTRWMRGFALGYVAGLVFFWWAFYWLRQVTGIGWFILPFYMGLYFAVWGGFMATVAKPWTSKAPVPLESTTRVSAARSVFRTPEPATSSALLRSRWNLWFAFLGAAAWVGLEWVRGWMFSGFGWNNLGVGLNRDVPFLQIVEWTGVGGVSFVAAFVNVIAVATVLRFILEVRTHRVRPHFDFTLTIAGLLLGVFLRHPGGAKLRAGRGAPWGVGDAQGGCSAGEHRADREMEPRDGRRDPQDLHRAFGNRDGDPSAAPGLAGGVHAPTASSTRTAPATRATPSSLSPALPSVSAATSCSAHWIMISGRTCARRPITTPP